MQIPQAVRVKILFLLVSLLFCFSVSAAVTDCGCLHEVELTMGAAGEDVLGLQRFLKERGFFQGEITGIFDLPTRQAVERFQKANNLKVTGKVDACTWSCIGNLHSEDPVSSTPPPGDLKIVVDIKYRTLTVLVDGRPFKSFPVAIGKPETPTPVGRWKIISKGAWSGGFGTRWLGLNVPFGIFGIHGTNKPWSIGRMESHGCIRMFNRDVEQLYRWVKHGTDVHIIGDPFIGRRRLLRGEKGGDVWFLQKRLRQLNLYEHKPDGVFGYGTEQAVKAFQRQAGLPVTGQVGWREYGALRLLGEE